jgi:hypothetical protein
MAIACRSSQTSPEQPKVDVIQRREPIRPVPVLQSIETAKEQDVEAVSSEPEKPV